MCLLESSHSLFNSLLYLRFLPFKSRFSSLTFWKNKFLSSHLWPPIVSDFFSYRNDIIQRTSNISWFISWWNLSSINFIGHLCKLSNEIDGIQSIHFLRTARRLHLFGHVFSLSCIIQTFQGGHCSGDSMAGIWKAISLFSDSMAKKNVNILEHIVKLRALCITKELWCSPHCRLRRM